MALPKPVAGLVVQYSYLWWREFERGQEEGVKDRPCVVVLVTSYDNDEEGPIVTVLPVTHVPPADASLAVDIPHATKLRLDLDAERSWVMLTEANRFLWPGPDLRASLPGGGSESGAYGLLPRALFHEIRDKFADAIEARLARVVR